MRLFSPFETESLRLKNRLVKSATAEAMATRDGYVIEDLIDFYKKLAGGGVGTIITGYMYVSEEGKSYGRMPGISGDEHVDGLSRLVGAVEEVDDSVIFVAQVAHAGRQTPFDDPVAPSAVPDPVMDTDPRKLRKEEVKQIIQDFVLAALRAERAGFDAVQLHAAHGYLLSQFLSPHTNRRNDEYGRERAKILIDIMERIRESSEIPVMVKMNARDFVPGGLEIEEAVRVARMLDKSGFEAIEVSGGMIESIHYFGYNVISQKVSKSGEAYFKGLSRRIRRAVKIPVVCVGGIRSLEVAEELLDEHTDLVSMARPLIRDPYLPEKWMEGKSDGSDCKSCNLCLNEMFRGEELACYDLKKVDS